MKPHIRSRAAAALVAVLLLFPSLAGFAQAPPTDSAEETMKEHLRRGLFEEEANRNFDAAAESYQAILESWDTGRAYAATALFRLGEIARKRGNPEEAAQHFTRVAREFPDHDPLARLARENLTALGAPAPAVTEEKVEGAVSPEDGLAAEEAAEIRRMAELVRQSPDLINSPDAEGKLPLSKAAAAGKLRLVSMLLENGAAVNGKDANGRTALHEAAEAGHLAVTKRLLEGGAETDPLYSFRKEPVVEQVAPNTSKTTPGEERKDQTPLHLALENRRAEVAKLLVEKGVSLNAVKLQRMIWSHGGNDNQFERFTPLCLA